MATLNPILITVCLNIIQFPNFEVKFWIPPEWSDRSSCYWSAQLASLCSTNQMANKPAGKQQCPSLDGISQTLCLVFPNSIQIEMNFEIIPNRDFFSISDRLRIPKLGSRVLNQLSLIRLSAGPWLEFLIETFDVLWIVSMDNPEVQTQTWPYWNGKHWASDGQLKRNSNFHLIR